MRGRRLLAAVIVGASSLTLVSTSPASSAPPGSAASATLSINGTYIPVAGNFDCDDGPNDPASREEPAVLLYAPGSAPDYLWTDLSISGGTFHRTQQQLTINRSYVPIVSDFDLDGCDDILWYGSGTATDTLWWGGPSGFIPGVPISVNGSYRPVMAAGAILWYAPHGTESYWVPTGDRAHPFTSRAAPQVSGANYQPVAMANGWNGFAVVLWYGPGSTPDSTWSINPWDGNYAVAQVDHLTISGTYRTTRWGTQAILHGPGTAPDSSVGIGNQNTPVINPLSISGTYVVGGKDRVLLWHGPGSARDEIWLQPN